MGVVYRARDTKLGRDVAIKALPEAFAKDADRLQRFQREAQILASLNHPNIAHIYGLEESDVSRCIAMELVEGETLQQRLTHGAIPIEEALHIAKQLAEALEAAHERGILHRDLKPGDIMLTQDGKVKVLDFGLAKSLESQPASNLSNSPTLVSAMSSPGVVLGTACYMSPEQAKGRPVDKRTDVFAFGCVFYEMLKGKRAFDREDVSEIIGAILKTEPDWTILPAGLSPRVREMIELCLQKDAKRRRRDAGDLVIDIERVGQDAGIKPAASSSRLAWTVTFAAAIAAAVLAAMYLRARNTQEPDEMRVEITTPATQAPLSFALSPDGKSIVFVASGDGPQRLWLRRLDKTDAQPLAGTDGADYPFWSPDNRSLGFFANGKLKRIDLAGGPPHVLADAGLGRGGSWGVDNTILFAPTAVGSLLRLNATGVRPSAATTLKPGMTGHLWPQFLPDGKSFLYWVRGNAETQGIYIGTTDGGESKRLTAADTSAAYLPPDHVVYLRQTALLVPFDAFRRTLIGDPVTIADPVWTTNFAGGFSVSASGRLTYRTGSPGQHQLVWFDRTGKQLGVVGEPDSAKLQSPEISPDGRRLAVDRTVNGNTDIWLVDVVRGGQDRFTFDPTPDGFPLWSPDGTKLAFSSAQKGPYNIYLKASSRTNPETLLVESNNLKRPLSWSKTISSL
jgi:predicted Ser/Thr protein kinase